MKSLAKFRNLHKLIRDASVVARAPAFMNTAME